ncbi:MAG: hypothetical protein EPO28_12155 [Saprospiraceae bacterium]|nr:MAG: hypothetical protein EPO28_12155 [Saprospiraceae bacterium]
MRNSVLLSSDLQSVILVDTKQNEQRLAIGKRGVLLSVLGTDICASEVPAELDGYLRNLLKQKDPFYEFEVAGAESSQLCITYNDVNNTVFIIGITDIDVGFAGPTQVPDASTSVFAVRLKANPAIGLTSPNAILVRLEGGIGTQKYIRFYHLPVD